MSCQPCAADIPNARVRVAMCLFCKHADTGTGAYASGVTGCTLNGKTIIERYAGADCPLERVRADGTTRWLGLVWLGVPMVHRVWLRWFHPSKPRINSWSGCGCIRVFKEFLWHTPPQSPTVNHS